MIGELETVVLDTRDPKGLATFYAQLLDARIVADEQDWVSIMDAQGRKLSRPRRGTCRRGSRMPRAPNSSTSTCG